MKPVTVRAVAIACGLMPFLALWVVTSEMIWESGNSTVLALFYHVTVVLLVLSLLNLLIGRYRPGWMLSPGELMTIYVMLSVAGTMCAADFLQSLIPSIAFPIYHANPQNRWEERILQYLPEWAILTDRDAAASLALGNSSVYDIGILSAWAKPVLFWTFFILAMTVGLICLNNLFRKQWVEREHLAFPIIQIPLSIVMGLPKLLSSKVFWVGAGIAGSIDILNGFNHFFPNLPMIPIVEAFSLKDYLVERPWKSVSYTTLNLYPFAIGLAFFLPAEITFSCLLFFFLYKLELVGCSLFGARNLPGIPFTREQSSGGFLGLGLLALWSARNYLGQVGKTILGRPGGLDESTEPMRYRTAFAGLVASAVLLIGSGICMGASLSVMIPFFLIFFLYCLAFARLRAELGPPIHDLSYAGPEVVLHDVCGSRSLSETNLATFSLFNWFTRSNRAPFSGHSMEGYKSAQLTNTSARSMMVAIFIAAVVGLFSAGWAMLHTFYIHGYSGRTVGDTFSSEAWWRMAGWIVYPEWGDVPASITLAIALVFTLLLGYMRWTFTWFALHPAGYAMSMSWSMEKLWACLAIAWLAKVVITRYGGAEVYRAAIPFFVGLVLGEFIVGSAWSLVGWVLQTRVYHFLA